MNAWHAMSYIDNQVGRNTPIVAKTKTQKERNVVTIAFFFLHSVIPDYLYPLLKLSPTYIVDSINLSTYEYLLYTHHNEQPIIYVFLSFIPHLIAIYIIEHLRGIKLLIQILFERVYSKYFYINIYACNAIYLCLSQFLSC